MKTTVSDVDNPTQLINDENVRKKGSGSLSVFEVKNCLLAVVKRASFLELPLLWFLQQK